MYLALCDDNQSLLNQLIELLEEYPWQQPLRYKSFPSGDALWFDYQASPVFDCMILDIEMPGMSGLELAKQVRDRGDDIPIVLLTAFDKYALAGYSVQPYQYLLKPVQRDQLFGVLKEIEQLLERKYKHCLSLEIRGGMQRIPLVSIRYMESSNQHIFIHTDDQEEPYKYRGKLDDVFGLCDDHFLRPHKSYIVNADRIDDISYKDRCIWLDNGSKIPISQKRKRDFAKEMAEFSMRYGHKSACN